MKLLVLLFIGIILYFIARSYKTEKFENIKFNIKENFQGDLLHHEAGLLIALMAKVAKADGHAIVIGHPHKNTLEAIYESKKLLQAVDLVQVNKVY